MTSRMRCCAVLLLTFVAVGCNGNPDPVPFVISINGADTPLGPRGSTVVVAGVNFGSTQGLSQVLFTNSFGGTTLNGPIASPADWSDGLIVTTVPSQAVTGGIQVQTGGGVSAARLFSVTADAPFNASTGGW